MPLSQGLSLWLYPAALLTTPPTGLRDYRSVTQSLEFTTVAPGGFGTLSATFALSAKHLSRPELQLFARLALRSRGNTIFLGELTEITVIGQGQDQAVQITALGVGNCLRDDPANFSYSAKTAKQIIDDQFTTGAGVRNAYNMPVSFDQSQVFPDNPGATYTLSYAWRTIEEILNDVCTLAGGYVWCVWEHPTTTDALGFSVGRLEAHIRDTSTTHYQATIQTGEVSQYSVTQSSERAYNRIEVGYNEPSSGPPLYVSATDSRLAGSGAINIAPFRRRKWVRDFAGNSAATSTNAQIVANTVLAQYKNGGNKVDLSVTSLRDANGANVPLCEVRADKNIYVPDLAGRGISAPTGPQATVNQFYIVSTTYRESQDGMSLELACDNYANRVDVIVARLQLEAERRARTGDKKTEMVQALGAAVKQWANGSFIASAGSQAFALQGTTFRPILLQAPTSISWAAATYQVNCTGPAANNLTQYGFNGFVTSSAAGALSYGGSYTTVGNCVYLSDEKRGLYDFHCEQCGEWARNRSLKEHTVLLMDVSGPALAVLCPHCGCGEWLNLGLAPEDETEHALNHGHRAEQARHIRMIMAHKHVGLASHLRKN